MIQKYLSLRSVQAVLTIIIYSFVAKHLPEDIHRFLYTISLLIKDLVVLMMPITVFAFIAHTISSFKSKAILFIMILLCFEITSNLTSVWYAIISAEGVSSGFASLEIIKLDTDFGPLWRMSFEKPWWWGANYGSFLGLFFGLFVALVQNATLKAGLEVVKISMEFILTKVFARFIPIFVLGFVAQIYKTGMLNHMASHYGILVIYLLFFMYCYIFLIFFIGAKFNLRTTFTHIKNMLPAWSISLTTGCSLSTMPWTIKGASQNLDNPDLAKALIPATTNIQQIGDCIMNTFLCVLIYNHFYGHLPDFEMLLNFSIVFVLMRFATAAIIGGAIFVMLPIYQEHLSFNNEMIAIILAMNVVLDPIVTSSNVVANGGLARIFELVWSKIHRMRKSKVKPSEDMWASV
jgi:Na+/H+-dicarboxylate symporter